MTPLTHTSRETPLPDFLQEIEELAIDVKGHLYSAYDVPSKDRVRAALGALDYLLMRLEKIRDEVSFDRKTNLQGEVQS